jgi:hypothetical protein
MTKKETTYERFLEFEEDPKTWGDDSVYTTRHVANKLGVPFRNARYHMMKLVDEGHLCQIKFEGSTWYLKRKHYPEFVVFRKFGVKVL